MQADGVPKVCRSPSCRVLSANGHFSPSPVEESDYLGWWAVNSGGGVGTVGCLQLFPWIGRLHKPNLLHGQAEPEVAWPSPESVLEAFGLSQVRCRPLDPRGQPWLIEADDW